MCDLVTGGKGRSSKGWPIASGEGDLSQRSAFAIGMIKLGGGSGLIVLGRSDVGIL